MRLTVRRPARGGTSAAASRQDRWNGLGRLGDRYGILIGWAALIVVFGALRPDTFLTADNFRAILSTQATLVILALALLVPLTVSEFDLSVAGTLGLAYVLMGYLTVEQGWPLAPAIAVALLVGPAVGIVNSFFIIGVGVESIVVTLGTGTALIGVGFGLLDGPVVGISQGFVDTVNFQVLDLPLTFYVAIGVAVVLWYIYSLTRLGRYMFFVGVNRSVSRLAGIRVDRIRAGALIAAGTIAAVAGVLLAGQSGASDPSASASYLFPVFAAVFLGATTITPGRFNPWGTVVAVYFLTTGVTGMQLLGLVGWVENVFYGCALVLAVTLSRLAGRQSVQQAPTS
jgi:ribose transport system permease protein